MRFYEIKTTPQQARINALKQQKERVNKQLKTERESLQKQRALANIQKNNQVLVNLRKN